jgi:hypothetical protein
MRKAFILLLLVSTQLFAKNITEIRDILKHVETNYRPHMIGDGGDSYGILQIQQGAIDDVNRVYGTDYNHQDAFDITCAEEIFELYITIWTKNLEKKQQRAATEEDIVRIWNGGPQGWRRSGTLKYLSKYNQYKKDMSLNTRQCYVSGRVGTITATYNHTVDIYVYKFRRVIEGVSRKAIRLIPIPKKPTQLQLKLDI